MNHMPEPMIGIDLGTTNSVLAVWRGGQPEVLADAGGRRLTPSVVGIDDDGSVLVGHAAKERLLTHPGQTIAAFKRRMGTQAEIDLGSGQRFRPEELSALVLKQLVRDAQAHLVAAAGERPGLPIRSCVISVPAYFNDTQRKATRIAGELAGLDVTLINEPTGAAIAYGIHDRRDQQKLAVVDLGGGTLDVSILEFFDGVMEVHATAGDNFLGGEDFDQCLMTLFAAHHDLRIDGLSLREQAVLKQQAVRAKHRLSVAQTATMQLVHHARLREHQLQLELSRTELEAACKPLLDRLRATLERALKDARLDLRTLDDVVLVGGATRMPMVRNLVGRLFGRLPLSHLDPDEVVGMGAAVQAGLRANDQALSDFVLTDVCPYSLGIEIAVERERKQHEAGHFLPIIERNTVVPVSRVERVVPVDPKQKVVQCRIFQGESRLVRNNIELGAIDIQLPRDGAADGVDVRFTYDADGILEVSTQVVASKETKSLVIVNSGRTLDEGEIAQRLARLDGLKVHPREQQENRACVVRAERLFEECLGDERAVVAAALRDFEAVLDRQDPAAAQAARERLNALLDRFDRDIFGP